jgi:hypothetical protein
MYKGVEILEYDTIDSIELTEMGWSHKEGFNYLEAAYSFIDKHIDHSILEVPPPKHLTSLILENVHDHGSGSCKLIIGKNNSCFIIEVYEEKGGFDLNNLPKGKGKWGFNEMKRSRCEVSHSQDGKRTFISIPMKK